MLQHFTMVALIFIFTTIAPTLSQGSRDLNTNTNQNSGKELFAEL